MSSYFIGDRSRKILIKLIESEIEEMGKFKPESAEEREVNEKYIMYLLELRDVLSE
jgi:hypothetical protein